MARAGDNSLSDPRLNNDIELQSANSRRSSDILESINQFAIDEDNEGIVYEPGNSRHALLSTDRNDTLKQKINAVFSLQKNKKRVVILTGVIVFIWTILVIAFARSGNMANTNLYHPEVGNGSDAYSGVKDNPDQGKTDNSKSGSRIGGIIGNPNSKEPMKMSLEDERLGLYYTFQYGARFIDISEVTVENDEGYYIHRVGSMELLKKASDPTYEKKLFASGTNEIETGGKKYKVSVLQLSSKLDKALVVSDWEQEFRHSSFGRYFMLDIDSGTMVPLFSGTDGKVPKISFAQLSPKSNFVTFVYNNNVFLKYLVSGKIIQVTDDGSDNIFNGKPDWVYEEEVLNSDKAVYWCPDESHFAYIKFDDTEVPQYNLEFFKNKKYPEIEKLKYPKPGFDNPLLSVNVYSVDKQATETVSHYDSKLGRDFIVYQIAWITSNELLIKESNRASRLVDIRVYNSVDKSSTIIRSINTSNYDGWYLNNGDLYVLPESVGGYIDSVVVDYYDHLGYFESATATEPKILTKGQWDVMTGVLGYNDVHNVVYFVGTAGNALERQIYQTSLEAGVESVKALTDTSLVSTYSLSCSPGGKYGYITYSGPSLPSNKLVDMAAMAADFGVYESAKNLNTVKQTEENLKSYLVPTKDYFTVTLKDGISIDVVEVKPLNFDPSNKYPILVAVYGGPGSQKLNSEFSFRFDEIVASSLEAIVYYIDPRGTGGRGWKYKSHAKDKIGYWEPRDITEVTQKLVMDKGYIDDTKTAIWGWSYGGFTTLKTLEYDHGVTFKYGMAVAPVTNWLLYDSIYTERYMNTPGENPDGYNEISQITDIGSFKNVTRFLIMHGTGDDNVHIQNTMDLLGKFDLSLVENYDMHIFPDSNHNINYNNANTIVYDKLFNWLREAFDDKFV